MSALDLNDPRMMAAMMQQGQQHQVLTAKQEQQILDAEAKQIRLFAVQMAVQAGVTEGAQGIVDSARTIAAYVTGSGS